MRYSDIPAAHTVVAYCKSRGIRQVVLSPGSRNAPLILGFSSDPFFECFSIVDERSAAFFALGLSQQSMVPTALVCTSGSALLNYYPAVAEAYYSRIPLVVLSADRPAYKIDIGDGQTIRQNRVFDRHIGYQASLIQDVVHATDKIRWEGSGKPASEEDLMELQVSNQEENENFVEAALRTTLEESVPVHLNIPLEEPLYGTRGIPPVQIREYPAPEMGKTEVASEKLAGDWIASRRKMILVGTLPPGALSPGVVECLAADTSVLVFTETTSNLHHPAFFPSIDSIMAPIEKQDEKEAAYQALQPDLLLTMGGMVVSKKIKQFLRSYPPGRHWHLGPFQANDTFFALSGHIRQPPDEFLKEFLPGTSTPDGIGYREHWARVRREYETRRAEYTAQIPFCDFKAFHLILESLPEGYQVQLANSSTVRYSQLFDMHPGNPVYCNRGTSGIEGSTSTAVGAAHNYGGPTLLLSGDLGFLYDINGLWNDRLKPDFRIIVINNGGGGIFRILPGSEDSQTFASYFETVHARRFEPLCEAFGLEYRTADSEAALRVALDKFWDTSRHPVLLEVRTPREVNDRILLDYFEYLS